MGAPKAMRGSMRIPNAILRRPDASPGAKLTYLTVRGSDTFAYDQVNRLKTATVGGTATTYAYDGDGKRASSTVGGTTTTYAYDANRSLPVVLKDATRKYVWGL